MIKIKPPDNCTRHNCAICDYSEWHGFERRLIMKGKDKRKYVITNFYSCTLNKDNK